MFENSYFNIQDIFVGYFVTSISVSAISGGGGGESKTPKCTDSIANMFDPFSEGGKTTKRNGVPGEVWKGLSPSVAAPGGAWGQMPPPPQLEALPPHLPPQSEWDFFFFFSFFFFFF